MRTRKRIVSLLLAVVMIFGSLGNSIIAETIPSDTLTEPMATETSLEIEQDQPHETEPLPTEPAPTEPAPTEPAPTEPAPTEPAATEPAATEPLVTEPLPTEPQATESEANDPVVTEPAKEAPLETKAPEAEETKPELLKDLYIFYVDGVEADRQDVTHGDLLEFPELKSREPDFTFEGWFIAGLDTSLDPTKPIAVDTGGQVIEVRAVFTKVEPEPVDEEAYGPQVPYAPVLLPGSMSRMARSFSTMAAASTHEVDASTPDASLAAGQFKLSKSAALVPGKVNEWDVTLRVTGRQSETYSDIVLVIDRSGSMAGNKLTQAKAAANLFIDTVLSMPNTRIAVVSYSDSITRHGSAPYFSSNAATLKGYVNSLSANGFTHTQGGLRAAREILGNHALSGARKTIVLLSDGLPNRSYEGSGSAAVTAAIGEANAARSNGYSVYAIGLMLDASGQSTMMSIGDTGKYYYTDNPANLTPIFLAIAGSISSAVTAATVTDPMASGFIIADTGTITKTGASSTANYDSGTLTWTFPSLTQPTGTVNVLYEEVKYRIVITEDTPFASGSMPANGATPMNFTDASGASSTNYFPIPEVDPVFVTLDKILLDVNGESVSSTESFTVNIGG
ncbi:MAG TPA: VWA domain-containing protein, partial [Clostridiaceae bacterium]|nr:VWA domain-containing protein [Clostridiaceae bacterium]